MPATSIVPQINLNDGQRAERKLLITVAEWTEPTATPGTRTDPIREILGKRTEDSSIDYNTDIATSTDILGFNYTDVNKTQPEQAFDPFLILGGSKLAAYLNYIRNRNALTELSDFTIYVITAFIDSGDATATPPTHAYQTQKQEHCTIEYQSIGGDVNVNMPITVHYSNEITFGTVDKLSSDFVFSEVTNI